jgi:hypothetical protein
MAKNKNVVTRIKSLGEDQVTKAVDGFNQNRALVRDRLTQVVEGGKQVRDDLEDKARSAIDNLRGGIDLDQVRGRVDNLESDLEALLTELSGRIGELAGKVTDLRDRLTGSEIEADDEAITTPQLSVVETPASEDLQYLTVKALRDLAKKRGIEVPNRIKKADLLALIQG